MLLQSQCACAQCRDTQAVVAQPDESVVGSADSAVSVSLQTQLRRCHTANAQQLHTALCMSDTHLTCPLLT